jgi:hypothetical protein
VIGTYLSLDLPSLSDTFSNAVTKTATALSALRDSIAAQATPSALDINSALEFNGNWAQDVGGVILADGNAPAAAGSIYYHAGEFYAIDSTGPIQLTNTGALNIASVGTIGGDYGGSNPAAVVYNAANNEYRFYQNEMTASWGGLVAGSVKIEGTSGSVDVVPGAGLGSNVTLTLPTVTLTMPAALPTEPRPMFLDSAGAMTTGNGTTRLGRQVFTASGTYTPTAGTRAVLVRMVGGGGGGGGSARFPGAAPYNTTRGAGGASGVYVEKWIINDTPLGGGEVTIGAGGAAGSSAGGNGGDGGPTEVTIGGTTYIAPGGPGGAGDTNGDAPVAGGVANPGFTALGVDLCVCQDGEDSGNGSGDGGGTPFGAGGRGSYRSSSTGGRTGYGYGAGGGGGFTYHTDGLAQNGGAGLPGVVIIDEFA